MAARSRGSTVGRWFGDYLLWAIGPAVRLIVRLGVSPATLTLAGGACSVGAGVAAGFGALWGAGWLYLLSGILDVLDGRVARVQGRVSAEGALLDAVTDRYGEACVFVGLAYFYRGSWAMLIALAALVGSFMVSYVRARSEGLGLAVVGGIAQRAERIVLLGLALAASPFLEVWDGGAFGVPQPVLAIVLGVLAISANVTAVLRLRHALHHAASPQLAAPATLHRPPVAHAYALPRSALITVGATACDFGAMTVLVAGVAVDAAAATFVGALVGCVVSFAGYRLWAFDAQRGPWLTQAWRHLLVSGTAAVLGGAGVALLQHLPGIDYRVAWGLARLVVWIGWNYPLQRGWVFLRGNV